MKTYASTLCAISAVSAAAFLAACSPADRQEVKNDASRATQTVKNETSSMAAKAGNAIDDAT
ncbi:MAG: hypothetical protein ACREBN_09075, partial [Burkholderiaceae bacterium]